MITYTIIGRPRDPTYPVLEKLAKKIRNQYVQIQPSSGARLVNVMKVAVFPRVFSAAWSREATAAPSEISFQERSVRLHHATNFLELLPLTVEELSKALIHVPVVGGYDTLNAEALLQTAYKFREFTDEEVYCVIDAHLKTVNFFTPESYARLVVEQPQFQRLSTAVICARSETSIKIEYHGALDEESLKGVEGIRKL